MIKKSLFLFFMIHLFFSIYSFSATGGSTINIAEIRRNDVSFVKSNPVKSNWYWQPRLDMGEIKSLKVSPGTGSILKQTFMVTNDEEGDYKLRIIQEEGDFTPNDIKMFHDNKLVKENDVFKIKKDDPKDFLLELSTPGSVANGDFSRFRIEAVEQDTKKVENKPITLIVEGAKQNFDLMIETSDTEVVVGETLTFKAKLMNKDEGAVQPALVLIDGEPEQVVAMAVVIPVGMQVVEVTSSSGDDIFKKRNTENGVFSRSRGDGSGLVAVGVSQDLVKRNEEISVEVVLLATNETEEENVFAIAMQSMNTETIEDEVILGDEIVLERHQILPSDEEITLIKSVDKNTIYDRDTIEFTFNITNDIEETINHYNVSDKIPLGFEIDTSKIEEEIGKINGVDKVEVSKLEDEKNIVLTFDIYGEFAPKTELIFKYETLAANVKEGNHETIASSRGYGSEFYYNSNDFSVFLNKLLIPNEKINISTSFSPTILVAGDEVEVGINLENSTDQILKKINIFSEIPEKFFVDEESILVDNQENNNYEILQGEIIFNIETNKNPREKLEITFSLKTEEDVVPGEKIITTGGEVSGKDSIFEIKEVTNKINIVENQEEKLELRSESSSDYVLSNAGIISYNFSLNNTTSAPIMAMSMRSMLPIGFEYIPDSIEIDGMSVENDPIQEGNILPIALIGDIDPGENITMSISFSLDKETVELGKNTIETTGEVYTSIAMYSLLPSIAEVMIVEELEDKITIKLLPEKAVMTYGEEVEYKIRVNNTSDEVLDKIEVYVEQPLGITVSKGKVSSLGIEEVEASEEVDGENTTYTFDLNSKIEPRSSFIFEYNAYIPSGNDEVTLGNKELVISARGSSDTVIATSNKSKGELEVTIGGDSSKLLLVTKKVNKNTVGIGELLKYTVVLRNTTEKTLNNIKISDKLPRGFKLQSGTSKVDEGYSLNVTDGVVIDFDIEGELYPAEDIELSYIVRVENSSRMGEQINQAWATGETINKYYDSNIASVKVDVEDDIFETKGIIFGRVFIDNNNNNIFDNTEESLERNIEANEEIGIPGIKVYLENGNYAITDREGKYSIYGQKAVTHIVKVDEYTIPSGAKLSKLTNRHNKNGDSSFADLKTGQLHKVNFAFIDPSPEFIEKVKARRDSDLGFYSELEYELERDYVFKSEETVNNTRDAQRVKDGHKEINFALNEDRTLDIREEKPQERLEDQLMMMDNTLGFIDLKDGSRIREKATIRIKGPRGGYLNLYVNNELIPLENLGSRASSQGNDLFFLEYNMVELNTGKNKLSIAFNDMFNIERERKSIEVFVPGKADDLNITVLSRPVADSTKPIMIKVEAVDKDEVKIITAFPLEAEIDNGRWNDKSLEKDDNVLRVNGTEGEYILSFIPPNEPGTVNFKFNSNGIEKKLKLKLNPNLRPMTMSGIVEGRYDMHRRGSNDKAVDNHIFEESLRGYDPTASNTYSRRNAVFAKGAVLGEYLMTLSYDDNKEEETFFKDIEADKHYPIYGDSSVRGYEAKSTSKLYLKLDKNHSTFLYGDYSADWTQSETSKLGKINKTLTGGYHKLDIGRLTIHSFAAETSYNQKVEEQRGKGISGPYHLDNTDIVAGSEKITIIVRDRVLSSIVIEEKELKRDTDYTMDYETASIYFVEPIPSMTPEYQPIFIRTSYEVDENGEKHWVWGNNLEYEVTEKLLLGWNYAKDDNPDDDSELISVFTKVDFDKNTVATAEYATTETPDDGNGKGWRVDFKRKTKTDLFELEYYDTDEEFGNDSSSLSPGKRSYNFKAEHILKNNVKVFYDSKFELDKETSDEKKEAQLGLAKKLNERYRLELKGRYAREESEEINESTSGAVRLTGKSKYIDNLTNFVEYEQDVTDIDKKRLALGSDYLVKDKVKLYFRQELFSTYEDSFALTPNDNSNSTLVGIESDYFEVATLFSEYSVQNSSSEKESKASMGVKKDIEINEKLSGAATFERIFPISYDDPSKKEESTAGTLSYKWDVDESKKLTGSFEGSAGTKKDIFTNRMGYVEQINKTDSLILKERYVWENIKEGEKRIKGRISVGYAHRDYDMDKSNWLFKYDRNYEKNSKDDYEHGAHIFSHARNYQISEDRTRTLTLAGKYVEESLEGYDSEYFAYMGAVNYSIDLTEKMDINFNGAVYGDEDFDEFRYGIGVEVGYRVVDNFWLSIGYNVTGFTDDDFDESGYYREGVYIRFRINVTEDLFDIKKIKKGD